MESVLGTAVVDPNDPAVIADRRKAVAAAGGRPLILNRGAYLAELVTGKRVLDCGCVNHCAASASDEHWLHRKLCEKAAYVLGVDILGDEVEKLRSRGYNVKAFDITAGVLDDRFDVIVCGEIIEHLRLPGALFDNCREMVEPRGILALSTPNPFYINPIAKSIIRGPWFVESIEHVAWFDPTTLYQLAAGAGFELVRYSGLRVTTTHTRRAKAFFSLTPLWIALGLRPELFAKSILYEFQAVA